MNGRILVVDDEPGIRAVCERTLSALEFKVDAAANGDAALRLLREAEFDFVLTDITMPGATNGTVLVDEIKRCWPLTDVVVMTGYPAIETAIPVLKRGAYDYLIKPFDLELLKSVTLRCFEKRRLSEELKREKTLRGELQAAYSELQKVERLKDAFLSRVNHELRTPLAAVLMAFECLAPKNPGAEGDKGRLWETMRSRLEQLRETVENLLLFSDFQAGGAAVERRETDVRPVLEAVKERYLSLCNERGLSVELSSAEGVPALAADPALLETAFRHLLLNAIQFSRRGGRISIRVEAKGSGLHVCFEDTGIGIPADKINMVFDSFYQAAEYLTREVGGLGLGLAIVRRIVEAHGGSVSVQSKEGEGSVFKVLLPVEGAGGGR